MNISNNVRSNLLAYKMEDEERPTKIRKLDDTVTDEQTPPVLSKSQLKKRRRQEEWESQREERKIKRKEKAKESKLRKRAAKEQLSAESLQQPKAPTREHHQMPVTFVIDCGFDDLMTDKEIMSLASQLTRCYSDNKGASMRAFLVVSSFGGRLKQRFDNVLSKHHKSWRGVRFFEEDYIHVSQCAGEWMSKISTPALAGALSKLTTAEETNSAPENQNSHTEGEVVYLTSESPNTLTVLKPYSTYVIGGLVDRNRHKGICYKRAVEKDVKTAKLPIGDYMDMKSRFILATNHVNEIMLKWLDMGDWGQAFSKVIPGRKGGVLKRKNELTRVENKDEEDLIEFSSGSNHPTDDEQNDHAGDAEDSPDKRPGDGAIQAAEAKDEDVSVDREPSKDVC